MTDNKMKFPKILIMGKEYVGKTSMRSVIFADKAPKDTFVIGYTNEINEVRTTFMGNMQLNICDCGGQITFVNKYLTDKKHIVFDGVEILIFVMEAERTKTPHNKEMSNENNTLPDILDIDYYAQCIKYLEEYSPNAKVFVLIHKMDLVADHKKISVFEKRRKEIEEFSRNFNVKCFPTSIWETSLYKAWTEIVSTLIIDINKLKESLKQISDACDAEEVILFESNTFLLTCDYSRNEIQNDQRFETISHIVKKFRLNCGNTNSKFNSLTLKCKDFIIYLDEYTKSTYMMIISKCNKLDLSLIKFNMEASKKAIEKIVEDK